MESVLVSCIMPTSKDRIHFISFAVKRFLEQDYGNKELIIVDDSDGSVKEILPSSDKIKYCHTGNKFATLGEKRNYACSNATGDIIVHWDDDDWYATDWLSCQVGILNEHNADICGLNKIRFFRPSDNKCWQYVYSYDKRPWVAGATLAYRKSAWEQQPFKKLHVGEDNHFVWESKLKVVSHHYYDGFVSILHQANTSPKHTHDSQWKTIPLQDILDILGDDLKNYHFFHQEPQ